jgi:hypothetical protein
MRNLYESVQYTIGWQVREERAVVKSKENGHQVQKQGSVSFLTSFGK